MGPLSRFVKNGVVHFRSKDKKHQITGTFMGANVNRSKNKWEYDVKLKNGAREKYLTHPWEIYVNGVEMRPYK